MGGIDLPIQELNDVVLGLSDRARIHQELAKVKGSLESLDREISSVQNLLASLQTKRDHHTLRIEQLSAAIAPHKLIPSEILAEIMSLAASGEGIQLPPPWNTVPLPWRLGQVCSRWRNIALNEPRIWSHIMLSEGCTTLPFMSMVEETFRRSGQAPLWLSASFSRLRARRNPINPLHSLVAPYMSRISTLELYNLSATFITDFLALSTTLVSVREVRLMAYEPFHVPEAGVTIFQNASNLYKFNMEGHPEDMGNFPCELNLPWRQLKEIGFTAAPLHPRNIHKILLHCSRLVRCSLDIANGPDTDVSNFPDGSIRLDHLEDLRVKDFNYSESASASSLFAPLILPALSQLTIYGPYVNGSATLADLFHRSSCPLTRLAMQQACYDDIGSIVEQLPLLKCLLAPRCNLWSSTIEKMSSGECAPHLQQVECCIHVNACDPFFDLLRKKWETEVDLPGSERLLISRADICVKDANDTLLDDLNLRRDELNEKLGPRFISIW